MLGNLFSELFALVKDMKELEKGGLAYSVISRAGFWLLLFKNLRYNHFGVDS
jgi:hypothetical protein